MNRHAPAVTATILIYPIVMANKKVIAASLIVLLNFPTYLEAILHVQKLALHNLNFE